MKRARKTALDAQRAVVMRQFDLQLRTLITAMRPHVHALEKVAKHEAVILIDPLHDRFAMAVSELGALMRELQEDVAWKAEPDELP